MGPGRLVPALGRRRPAANGGHQRCPRRGCKQATVIYGVSVDTLRRRIAADKLPASRFGVRLIRVRVENLDRLYRPIPISDELARRRTS